MRNINEELKNYINDIDGNFPEILKLCEPVIKKVISEMAYPSSITYEDLYQELSIKLYEVLNKDKDISNFVNYFTTCAKNRVIEYIGDNQFVVHIPRKKRDKYGFEGFKNFMNYGEEFENVVDEKDFTEGIDMGFEDERLERIREILTDEEWQMVCFMADNENGMTEWANKIGKTKRVARYRWNKILKKIEKEMKGGE